ncbi:hypothetical protein [Lacrimispora sp.]|uniref:hypothetical protein n=1 Tax=Lacrimispora sp. TaxID=2719234 RepID=UPI0028B06F05|nr:hypothetical protein [Lacrimispora sp.]
MITYEDCINYIENILPTYSPSIMNWKTWQSSNKISLSQSQKKLLKNLIEGKVTNCPRCMGKTFVIHLYADYLNYITDMCKYDDSIKAEDYISGYDCCLENHLLSHKIVKNALYQNKEKAMIEYNILSDEIEKFIPENELKNFSIGYEN